MHTRVIWAIAGMFCILLNAGAAEDMEKIGNASFEETSNGKLLEWQTHTWSGKAKFEHAQSGHGGAKSVSVESDTGADAGWRGTAFVLPFSQYRLSCWIKTENVTVQDGKGALVNVPTSQPNTTAPLEGTQDWTRVEVTFDSGATDAVEIHLLLGGWGLATGKVWFDDLALERIATREVNPAVTIAGNNVGEPISPYVYGQFIEHLGRCIYGGIWSEMLEDRKFFWPIPSADSPWRIYLGVQQANNPTQLAVNGRVEMSKENVFTGEHTPLIHLTGGGAFGLCQGNLAVRAGKRYVGRIVLCGEPGAGPVDVTLFFPGAPEQNKTFTVTELGPEYKTHPFEFAVEKDAEQVQLIIAGRGKGRFRVGTVSLMPGDNVHGMRADTLALLKELDAPVYRWPGGNFVSGYNWRDGIGDRDKRPPRKNPAWKGVEHNDFGLDEFMVFCRELGTEPYITVNSGLGDVRSAVEELEYANGAADTPMGRLRAENGHPEPYAVKWWAIGNEMYGNWQLGHMPLADYVKKHNAFAEAMRASDPSIKLIAVGATGEWSRTMLAQCADHMDLLSEHFYCGAKPTVMAHVRQIPDNVRAKAEAHRQYHRDIPALAGKKIPIALDEWNYWHGPDLYGEIGVRYFLKDALGIAAGLHEYFRNSDIFLMANYAQTVNVIGAIKTSKTAAAFDTTGLVLKLYRNHFGSIPIRLEGDPAPLDASAAWNADRRKLTVGIVNPTRSPQTLKLELQDVKLKGTGRAWTIAGSDPMAYNDPEHPNNVKIEETAVDNAGTALSAPALGIMLYELDVQ